MKKIVQLVLLLAIYPSLHAQISTRVADRSNMTIKENSPGRFLPGYYPNSTPVTNAPISKGSIASFYLGGGAYIMDNDPQTRYIPVDINSDNTDELLTLHPYGKTVQNSIKILGIGSNGEIKQAGEYGVQQTNVMNTTEVYAGKFSYWAGKNFLEVDRRANQFWAYLPDFTNLFAFVSAPKAVFGGWLQPDRFLTGDFNGDGYTDLAAWDRGSNQFQVALFTVPTPTNAGLPPSFTAKGSWLTGWVSPNGMTPVVGDFNGDRKDDIALLHAPSGEWRVALSNGAAFQPSTGVDAGVWLKPFAAGTGHRITALDANNDGLCDIVDYNENDKSFQVVLSNGTYFDYMFPRVAITPSVSNPEQVVVLKFQGRCMVSVSHVLPPDNYYLNPRRVMSSFLCNYQRMK